MKVFLSASCFGVYLLQHPLFIGGLQKCVEETGHCTQTQKGAEYSPGKSWLGRWERAHDESMHCGLFAPLLLFHCK